ncbi:MAG: flagellar basal body-associated FliL family protein [Zoogloeaceae bacterium]|nr:flagellar basal body-associated FliL family protein [Zoogloeaceae bacterium]
MAKAPAKPEAEGAPAPKGGSKKLLMILIILVVLLLAAAGGVVMLLLSKNKHSGDEAAADHHEEAKPKVVVDKSHPPVFVPLEPFTVNLATENGDHFLQTSMVLRVADAKIGEDLKAFMPEIRHRMNLILSSRKPSEISAIQGREELADELMEETNDVLGYPPPARNRKGRAQEPSGPVLAVLFSTFIIQ